MMFRPISARQCLALALIASALAGCGTGSLDLAGYPDTARDRLYAIGRLGGDKGLTNFDLRKAWRAVAEL